jgi:hypothetical protein
MGVTRHRQALFRGATLRRIRLLGAASWLAGCANLIGLNDYSESDDPVRHSTGGAGGDGTAGSAGAIDAGAPSTGGRGSGGRPATTGGRAPTTGGKPSATGGAPIEGGEGPGPTSGGHRATGGRRSTGGAEATGGTENTGGSEPGSGGTAPTGGANGTGGAPVTSCALPAYPESCGECIDDSCNASCNPCLADADCRALVACAQGCFSNSCLDSCFEAHEDSADAFLDIYDTCAFTTCASTCGARFGASCDEDDDCASGTCSGPGGYCTSLCDDHDDCPLAGWCAQDVDGIARCLVDCSQSESACPPDHHCGFVSTIDDYALPLCTSLSALSEPCTSDEECHSFYCTGTANSPGWCSNPCVDNLSCATDASCVFDSFDESMCLLNCSTDAECDPYPASTCSPEIDLDDNDVDVCWL